MYPRNRVLVLDSENLFADTAPLAIECSTTWGWKTSMWSRRKVYNRGFYHEKIDPRVADRLREHYRPYDEMLAGDAWAIVWLDDAASRNRLWRLRRSRSANALQSRELTSAVLLSHGADISTRLLRVSRHLAALIGYGIRSMSSRRSVAYRASQGI